MSEPSSGVPSEISDAEVEQPQQEPPERVELDVDEDKLEAWDKVKSAYEVEPGGEAVPNSSDTGRPDAEPPEEQSSGDGGTGDESSDDGTGDEGTDDEES